MKKTILCFALAALLGMSGQAVALIGTIDAVPAATLLLPYFEVDLDNPNGQTTLFSINNASQAPVLVHVTLWSDLSVPTLDFPVFLTGFDVVTFNLRDLFTTGFTPRTQHQNLPTTPNSPRGIFSDAALPGYLNAATCNGVLPLPNVPPGLVDHIRRAHTGVATSLFGANRCYGVNHGDNVARGYITVDIVNQCTVLFPDSLAYHSTVIVTGVNQIWGDVIYIDRENNDATGNTLVHIESDNGLGAGNYTFYRRYSDGLDRREGLASTWASRYLAGGAFDGGTDLQVWRDAKRPVTDFSCAAGPPSPPYPLVNHQIVIFDEQENPDVPDPGPGFSPPVDVPVFNPFPWETQRVAVGGPDFPVPFIAGWVYLNLNSTVAGQTVPFGATMQNHVATQMTAEGAYMIGFDAIQLDNVTFPNGGIVFVRGADDTCLGPNPPGAHPCL